MLKLPTKNATHVTQRLSSNIFSDDETNFPKLLLIDRQVQNLHRAFVSNSSANIKFFKNKTV